MSGSTMVFARPGGFRRVTASVASAALFASVGLPPVAFAQGGGAQPIIVEGDQVDGRLQEAVACPSAPQLIAFQRVLDREYLDVYDTSSQEISEIKSADPNQAEDIFAEDIGSFEGQADWMPVPDDAGRHWLTYVGGGNFNNKDIYVTYVGAPRSWRLTDFQGWDQAPKFSPDGKRIVFVSARTGAGDLYLIENVDQIRKQIVDGNEPAPETGIVQLTDNPDQDLFPEFDPTGRFVAYSEKKLAENERTTESNMGIAVIDLDNRARPPARLTLDAEQETRPSWSPDGNRIAYYVSHRVEDPEVNLGLVWVVYGKKSGAPVLGQKVETGVQRAGVAENVAPSPNRGPSWLARSADGSSSKSVIYVRLMDDGSKGIFAADVEQWEAGKLGYEAQVESGGVDIPQDVGWGFDGRALFSGQAANRYGVYAGTIPPQFTTLKGEFEYRDVEEPGGGISKKVVIVGGGLLAGAAVAVGVLAGGGGSTGTTAPPIGNPPCPPGEGGSDCTGTAAKPGGGPR